MIIEFGVKNFKSIREKVILSMVASKDSSHIEELYEYNKINILRGAVLYGANASGKTTFIDSLAYFRYLVTNCGFFQEGDKLPRPYHKLSKDDTTGIDIQFIFNGIKYAYGFEINDNEVVEEYLYHFPNKRQAKIFDRKRKEYSFGVNYRSELSDYVNKTKDNKLFLNIAEAWSKLDEIINPFIYIRDNIVVRLNNLDNGPDNWFDYSVIKINEDNKMKGILIEFLQKIGLQVKDIKVKVNDETELPEPIKMLLKQFVDVGNNVQGRSFEVRFIYESYSLDLSEESLGTQKLFMMICPLVDILLNKKVLFYDELENSLHPIIVLKLIETFKKWDNPEGAQLIFTTYDTSLLDLNIFRRDQIWFAEKNPDTCSSDYYSLIELKNVRKDDNIRKGFINGRYSRIPLMGSCLVEILEG